MIIVKFQSGALGHFLCCVLHKDIKPFSVEDYKSVTQVLHTGSYHSGEYERFQKDLNSKEYHFISHNNVQLEPWILEIKDADSIFIDLKSNFVEYRLNYIFKMPEWNNKMNEYAVTKSWKDYEHPVAYDDARRIFRLNQNLEQQVKPVEQDIIFNFKNFYIADEEIWVNEMKQLIDKIGAKISRDELSLWHKNFRQGQSNIIERAKILYDCIDSRKFVSGLTENEKGIIIGYCAVANSNNTPEYFKEAYDNHSVSG
jgi:hypothetical protein